MKLNLKRIDYLETGIFGVLSDENGVQIAVTLEHPYDSRNGDGSYVPKVASGTYTCLRHAPKRLPYETWELQHVPPFEGQPVDAILIHIGNFAKDSIGCILLGDERNGDMIMNSKVTFKAFMDLTSNENSLTLTIT